MAGWAPLLHLPVQACLPRSGASRDSPREGESMGNVASITLSCAKRSLLYFIYGVLTPFCVDWPDTCPFCPLANPAACDRWRLTAQTARENLST